MTTKTFYFKNATASGSSHGSLQDGGSAPTAAQTTTGWSANLVTTSKFSTQIYGTVRANSTFSATDAFANLTSNVALAATDCWRSENSLNGYFEAANATVAWVFTHIFRTTATHINGRMSGRLNLKMFKSPNANGTANVTVVDETSGGKQLTAVGTFQTINTDVSMALTWTTAPFIRLYNEYLFLEYQFEVTTGGVGIGGTIPIWRVASTANVVSTNFFDARKINVT